MIPRSSAWKGTLLRRPASGAVGLHGAAAARGLLIASLLILVASLPSSAQVPHAAPPDTTPPVLRPVVAAVTRPAVLGSASALVAVLDSADVAPAVSLSELLRAMPLVRVRDNSRGESHLTLRGSESRQVSVAVDGIPLTIGWDNRTDLSVVPLTGATRIRAVRGLSSLLDGPNVLGGIVRIGLTPDAAPTEVPEPYRVRIGAANGRSVAGDLVLQHRGGSERSGTMLRTGGGYRRQDYRPVASSVVQPPVAVRGERLNSDLEQWNLFVAGYAHGTRGRWASLTSMAFGARRGVPPELHVEEPRLWRLPVTRRWVTVLGAGLGWGGQAVGSGTLGLRGAIDVGRFEIEAFDSPDYGVVTQKEVGEDRTVTLKLDGTQSLGWGELEASLTAAETRHDETLQPGARSRYRQRLFSGAAELALPLWSRDEGGGLGLRIGGSVDGSDTPDTGGREIRPEIWDWGAKVAATLDVRGIGGQAHAGISRRTRAPSLRELYSGALGRFVVNPRLGPETLTVAEAGLTGADGPARWQLVVFHQRLSDGIVRSSSGDGRFRRVNRDRVLATGLELLGGFRWAGLSLDGDLTLQDVGISDPTAPDDERRPEYQPALAARVELGVDLPASFLGRLRANYVGAQYCVQPELERDLRLDGAAWAGLEVTRSWTLGRGFRARTLRVVGGVHNLTDASVYDQCGLPAAGRQLTVTIAVG